MNDVHVPVMAMRIIALLAPALERPNAVFLDTTLGLGGHTEAVLEHYQNVTVVGIDRDPEALASSRQRLAPHADRIHLVHAVYDEIPEVLEDLGLPNVDGVLFDLGVSSMQLDRTERGFAYAHDAPLDMRMGGVDRSGSLTAADVLNTYTLAELARVLATYGEERFARRIASRIVAARTEEPFTNSARLVDLVREAIPAATRRTGGNPAKRTFQALRIEVNDELAVLSRALPAALGATKVGGRVVVMSYHSGEDRIAKRVLVDASTSKAPADLPVVPASMAAPFRLITRGSEQADSAEISDNPRSKSVRVRAVERVGSHTLMSNTDGGIR